MIKWLTIFIFFSSVSINALETGYKLTIKDTSPVALQNLVASANFIDIDLKSADKSFGVVYHVTDAFTGTTIFDGNSIINSSETLVTSGNEEVGMLTMMYDPLKARIETQLLIKVSSGSYNVVVNDFYKNSALKDVQTISKNQ